MEYEERAPPPGAEAEVRCIWTLRGAAADVGEGEPILPDGSPELILNLADPFEHVATNGRVTVQPSTFLVGQITGPFAVRPTGRVDLIAIRFESHGAALLHDDLGALTDHWAAAATLARGGVPALAEELARTPGAVDRAARVDDWVQRLVRAPEGDADVRVAEAVHEIRRSRGAVRLDELAERLGTSLRSLQRLFATQVGLTPKALARIVRFQSVFQAWREAPQTVGRVAAECGYADHAHLVRDFRELAGSAPARLLAETPDFTRLFTG
jgi:AraC-like DNA-binding protein